MPRRTKVIVDYMDGTHADYLCNHSQVDGGVLFITSEKNEVIIPLIGTVRRAESFYVEVDEKGQEV